MDSSLKNSRLYTKDYTGNEIDTYKTQEFKTLILKDTENEPLLATDDRWSVFYIR